MQAQDALFFLDELLHLLLTKLLLGLAVRIKFQVHAQCMIFAVNLFFVTPPSTKNFSTWDLKAKMHPWRQQVAQSHDWIQLAQ